MDLKILESLRESDRNSSSIQAHLHNDIYPDIGSVIESKPDVLDSKQYSERMREDSPL